MPRLYDWLNDQIRNPKIFGARLNAEFDNSGSRASATLAGGSGNVTSAYWGKFITITSSAGTITFDPVASLGDGFFCTLLNVTSGVVILDPSGSETIYYAGAARSTLAILPDEGVTLYTGGSGGLIALRNYAANLAARPAGHLFGFGTSNNGSDATNDIDITTGIAADSGNIDEIRLTSALTKQLDAAWAVGTNAGMRASGAAIADTTYHLFAIKRPDTGVVDIAADTSATGANIAANTNAAYTLKRRIWSIVRSGGVIRPYIQNGDVGRWQTPLNDVTAVNPGTAAVTRTVSVPTGIKVQADLTLVGSGPAAADNPIGMYLSDLSVTDVAANVTTGAISQAAFDNAFVFLGGPVSVMTDTSAQIRSRLQVSTANTTLYIGCLGWTDRRGRDA